LEEIYDLKGVEGCKHRLFPFDNVVTTNQGKDEKPGRENGSEQKGDPCCTKPLQAEEKD